MNIKTVFNRNNASGLKPVEYYIYIPESKQKGYIKTGVKIDNLYWDAKHMQVKNHPLSFEFNDKLNVVKNKITSYFKECYTTGANPTIVGLRDYIKGKDGLDFIQFIAEESSKEPLSVNTQKNIRNVMNKLKDCFGNVRFQDISYKMVKDFDYYMRELSPNTKALYHSIVSKYISLLIKLGISKTLTNNPYELMENEKRTSKLVYLTLEELKQLENVALVGKEHQVRNMFLQSCYTGFRFSDIETLDEAVVHDVDGVTYLTKTPVKTSRHNIKVSLPISLLFEGKFLNLSTFKLPYKEVWGLLPQVVRKAGIDKHITFHAGRHTFGTIMANKLQGDKFKLGKLMGITNERTLNVYVHTTDKAIRDSLITL